MHRCDVCTNGPPEVQDLKVEATILLQLIATHNVGTIDTLRIFLTLFYTLFYIFHLDFAKNFKITIL